MTKKCTFSPRRQVLAHTAQLKSLGYVSCLYYLALQEGGADTYIWFWINHLYQCTFSAVIMLILVQGLRTERDGIRTQNINLANDGNLLHFFVLQET